MLFIQAVTYSIAEPDDGTCETFLDKTSCLSEPSTLAQGENKCSWDDSTSACSFNEPANDLMRVVFVAVLSAMWSAPIALFVDWLIMKVLAARTYSSKVQRDNNGERRFSSKQINSVNVSQSNVSLADINGKSIRKTALVEVEELNEAIRKYRNTLPSSQLEEFDSKYIDNSLNIILN
jgi:hypothetical protein